MTRYQEVIDRTVTDFGDECWPFPSITGSGYAVLTHANRQVKAADLAYEVRYEPVAEGLELDHLCRNRWCWNLLLIVRT